MIHARIQRRRQIPQPILHPEIQNARIPRRVKRILAELRTGGVARGPEVAAEGRAVGRTGAGSEGRGGGDEDRVEEDEGGEEAWVDQGEVDDVLAAHAVADADERAGHRGAEVVGHVEEVAGVVGPGSWGEGVG